jgi:tetratricopeptide (TPR) repeat protein
LTQEELGARAGVSARAVRNIERGRVRLPRASTARLLGEALGLTWHHLDEFVARARDGYWTVRAAAPTGASTVPDTPAHLPMTVRSFAGRIHEMSYLDSLLAPRHGGRSKTRLVVVSGAGGVGKTCLVVQWAHRVAARFPDGQIFLNLRGYGPDAPMQVADALAALLTALGVRGADLPLDVDARSVRLRSELSGRRILVILDNVASAEQVRPCLPDAGPCGVVVTSRGSLAGLVTDDGARRLELDLLPPGDALALLRTVIGVRVDAEPAGARALVDLCARLPLALRLVAELAVARPAVPLAELAKVPDEPAARLDLVSADGDPRSDVRTVFSWSYRHLPPPVARMFRLVALHPGADFDPDAAAALANVDLERAHQMLDHLARAHLVQAERLDRYTMHDLLRAYAMELGMRIETSTDRRAALTRLFDQYLATAAHAMNVLAPGEKHRRPRPPRAPLSPPMLTDAAAAQGWLDAERANLVAVCGHAAMHGWLSHAGRISTTLYRYLNGGHLADGYTVHGYALQAAKAADDPAAQAQALGHLGVVHMLLGRYFHAAEHLELALALFEKVEDADGQARALTNLALVYGRLGRHTDAVTRLDRARAIFKRQRDLDGEAHVLVNLGLLYEQLGWYHRDADRQSLAMFEELGDRSGQACALTNLAARHEKLGRYPEAIGYVRKALDLHRALGERDGEAYDLNNLGLIQLRLGRHRDAVRHLRHALALHVETGNRPGEAMVHNDLGEAMLTTRRDSDALTHYTAALAISSEVDDRFEQARAHEGLARLYDTGDDVRAHRHRNEALAIYTAMGSAHADKVRAMLKRAQDGSAPHLVTRDDPG